MTSKNISIVILCVLGAMIIVYFINIWIKNIENNLSHIDPFNYENLINDNKKIEQEISYESASYKINAGTLYSEYEANEVAADLKYKGEVLEVSGSIDAIAKDLMNQIYVTLKGNDFIGDVQCFFADQHTNATAQLRKGQKITIRGKCDGKMMNILLKGCVIISYDDAHEEWRKSDDDKKKDNKHKENKSSINNESDEIENEIESNQ